MPLLNSIALLLSTVLLTPADPAAQLKPTDAKGCSDHPLVTRMDGMFIERCKTLDFDRFVFKTGKSATQPVEGKRFEIKYRIGGTAAAPSKLAIIRNHQQALAAIGATVQYEDARYTILKLSKDGREVWLEVDTAWNSGYLLNIVEKQVMTQEVVANAAFFQAGLQSAGHVVVPGIYFETAKADVKPESDAAIAEIAGLLTADPGIKLFVVGHTDGVASFELNLKLSQARAEAVVQALVTKHKIAAARLVARGVGPLAPVATNDTEEGRARNRRVELVKQ